LQVWAVEDLKGPKSKYPGLRFYSPDLVTFSPDGAHLAAGTNDGDLVLLKTAGGEPVVVEKAHDDIIRGVKFTDSGKWLASISDDRTVRLWAVPDLRRLKTFRGHD